MAFSISAKRYGGSFFTLSATSNILFPHPLKPCSLKNFLCRTVQKQAFCVLNFQIAAQQVNTDLAAEFFEQVSSDDSCAGACAASQSFSAASLPYPYFYLVFTQNLSELHVCS